jgi:tRNA pseudouridine55 synthase
MGRRRDRGRAVHGILLLDKPAGHSSNQVLQRAKRLYGAAKAGHTGSLDPLATGMLPICFGAATRVSSYLLDAGKRYFVEARLGQATDTADAEGEVIEETAEPPIGEQDIHRVLGQFLGESEQIPPMHSALKHQGRRLYQLAREGVEVERAPRAIRISEIGLNAYSWPKLEFTVECSKGTYVRTLVEDIARELGTVGHVAGLRRTAVEPFPEGDMVGFEVLEETGKGGQERLDALLQPVDSPLAAWPRVVVRSEHCDRLTHGQSVAALPEWPHSFVRLYDPENAFFGIGEVESAGRLVPRRIFPGLSSWC